MADDRQERRGPGRAWEAAGGPRREVVGVGHRSGAGGLQEAPRGRGAVRALWGKLGGFMRNYSELRGIC